MKWMIKNKIINFKNYLEYITLQKKLFFISESNNNFIIAFIFFL